MAVIAPARAHPLPGCWVIWKPAHSLTPSKVIVPAPFGSVMDSPTFRFSRTCAPLESLNPFSFDLSSWYTLFGMPALTPRSPWYGSRLSTGFSSAGNCETTAVFLPPYVGRKKAWMPSCSHLRLASV